MTYQSGFRIGLRVTLAVILAASVAGFIYTATHHQAIGAIGWVYLTLNHAYWFTKFWKMPNVNRINNKIDEALIPVHLCYVTGFSKGHCAACGSSLNKIEGHPIFPNSCSNWDCPCNHVANFTRQLASKDVLS